MFVKFYLEELFPDSGLVLKKSTYGTNHFCWLMNCFNKGSACILTFKTEHTIDDTLISYVNLNICELIDVTPKVENQIKELKNNIGKEQKDTLLVTIQNTLKK